MSSLSSSISPCPSGGDFYACPGFVGCCTTEICHGIDHCPDDNLKPASFNDKYSEIGHCHQGSNWVICENTSSTVPSFMGCCKSNNSTCPFMCPQGDLAPGFLISDQKFVTNLSPVAASSTVHPMRPWALSPTPTSTDTPNTSGESALETSTMQGSATPASVSDRVQAANTTGSSALKIAESGPRSNTAAIAGGVVGGIVGLACILGLLAIYCHRRTARPMQDIDNGRSPTLGIGSVRALQQDNAELEEMKQGPSPTSSLLRPPSPPPSSIPPPPAYTPYRSHGIKLNRGSDLSQPSDSLPHPPHDLPSPESPPSPPPLRTRLSQHSDNSYSEEQSVSPISSHYHHHAFDENERLDPSMYPEVSPSELLHAHSMRS